MSHFEPLGLRFFDAATQLEMLLVEQGQPYAGWLCYRHTAGHWVTLREATSADRAAIAAVTTADRRSKIDRLSQLEREIDEKREEFQRLRRELYAENSGKGS